LSPKARDSASPDVQLHIREPQDSIAAFACRSKRGYVLSLHDPWKDRRMKRFCLVSFAWLAVLIIPAAAENSITPGQWKVTSNTTMNGATMPPQVKARCLTPEQAGDLAKTFAPVMGTVNSSCERTEYEASEGTLKWRMQCKGQLDMDVLGHFTFDSQTHYTATITTKGSMAGALISDIKTELEGEHVGECPP
jgi:hypothetical protein